MKRLSLLVVTVLLITAAASLAQVAGDYRSVATGNWDNIATWQTYDGATWAAATIKPGAANNVYLQAGFIVSLTGNEACLNFTMHNAATDSIILGANTLSVNGSVAQDSSGVNVFPVKYTTACNQRINCAGGGKISIVGNSRTVFNAGQWSANPQRWNLDISMNSAQICTSATNLKAGHITVTSGTLVVNGALRPDSGAAGIGTLSIASGATAIVSGKMSRITAANSLCGLIEINGTLQAAGDSIAATNINVNDGGTFISVNSAGHAITGTMTFNTGSTLIYRGLVAQTTRGELRPSLYNLIVDNASGVLLGSSTTLNNILTLTNGILATGANTVTVASDSAVIRTNGYVNGNLAMHVAIGATAKTYPVGTANGYSPVAVAFGTVGTAGTLTAKATQASQPNVALPSYTLQRYWTITNSGVAFDNYSATLTYAAADFTPQFPENPAENTMIAGKYDIGVWTYPTIGLRTPGGVADGGNVQLTGLTSFSDFTMAKGSGAFAGDPDTCHVLSTSPLNGAIKVGLPTNIVITFNEPVDTARFYRTITPALTNEVLTWSTTRDTVTIAHDTFAPLMVYTVTVDSAFDADYGTKMAVPYSFSFTTKDTIKPVVVSTDPVNNATGIALNAPVTVAFSRAMDTASVIGNFLPSPGIVAKNWNTNHDTLTLSHGVLAYNTIYTVSWTAGTDTFGNPLAVLPDSFMFTTLANQGPVIVITVQPGDTYHGAGPFVVTATITDPVKKGAKSVAADTLYYTMGDTLVTAVGGTNTGGDSYSFNIPGPVAAGREVIYWLSAWDNVGARTDDGNYSFRVLKVKSPGGLAAAPSYSPNGVQLSWTSPRDTAYYYFTGQPSLSIWGGDTNSTHPAEIYATRFTPMYTPCRVRYVSFYFYPLHLAYAGVTDTATITFHVWSDSNGIPGHDLVTPWTYTWTTLMPNAFTTFDLGATTAPLVTGGYLVGCEYTNPSHPLADTIAGKPPFLASDMGTANDRNLDYYNGTWYNAGANFRIRTIDYYGPGAKQYVSNEKHLKLGTRQGLHRTVSDQPVVAENAKNLNQYMVTRDSALTGFVNIAGVAGLSYTDNALTDLTSYRYRVKSEFTAPDTFGLSSIVTVFADFSGPDYTHTPPADQDTAGTFVLGVVVHDTSNVSHLDSIYYWQTGGAGSPAIARYDSLAAGNMHWYHVVAPARDSVFYYIAARDSSLWKNRTQSTVYTFRTNSGVAGQPTIVPVPFYLANASPNPMSRGAAEFRFGLPQASPVKLVIYNVTGQRIATLVDGNLPAGRHTIRWNGANAASGVYIYKLQAGSNTATKKLIVVK